MFQLLRVLVGLLLVFNLLGEPVLRRALCHYVLSEYVVITLVPVRVDPPGAARTPRTLP